MKRSAPRKIYTFLRLMLRQSQLSVRDFLGLQRNLQWLFLISEVSYPIIGTDFLKQFSLLVDIKHQRLLDSLTKLTTTGQVNNGQDASIKLISGDTPYHELLREIPEITRPVLSSKAVHYTQCVSFHRN